MRFYVPVACDLTRILGNKNIWGKLFGEMLRLMVNNLHVHREDNESNRQSGRTHQFCSKFVLV